jgi:hypothetical protein
MIDLARERRTNDQVATEADWHSSKRNNAANTEHRPNENKMSDGGRERASLEMNGWKSSQKWTVQRSAVRSIAWLGL